MGTCPIFKSRKTKFYTPPITPSDEWYPNAMLGHITGGDSFKPRGARSNSSFAVISALEEQFHDAHACMPQQTVAHSHTHTYGPLSLIETHSVTITHHHDDLELGSTSATPTGSSVQLNRCQLQQQQLLHPTPAVRSTANSVVSSEHPSPRTSTSLQNSVAPVVVMDSSGGGAADQSEQPQGVSDLLQGATTSVAYRQPFTCSLTHSPSHNNVLINHANSF